MGYSIKIIWGESFSSLNKNLVRNNLRAALVSLNYLPCWNESISNPNLLRKIINTDYCSIIVNGHEILRISKTFDIPDNVKFVELIENYNKASRVRPLLINISNIFVGFLIAIFPKCPVCWATYMSMFGFIGASKIEYNPNFLYILISIALGNLFYTLYKSIKTKNYFPVIFLILGYSIIFSNRIVFKDMINIYIGTALLALSALSMHFKRILYKFKNNQLYELTEY